MLHRDSPCRNVIVNLKRRFPPPWSVEETDACFIVRDEIDNLVIPVTFIGAGTLRVAA